MNIVFVGLSGVPYAQRAIDIRLGSFARLFALSGHNVMILNRYSSLKPVNDVFLGGRNNKIHIAELCNMKGVHFPFSILLLLYTILIEFWKLIALNRKQKIDILHVASGHFGDILYYSLISHCIGAKVVYHYCEYRSAFKTRNLYHFINGRMINYVGPKFWDGAICISHFLVSKTKEINSNVKIVQIPPICNYAYFDSISCQTADDSAYLLFCGYTGYSEIIYMIIDAYKKSRISEVTSLKMIINGDSTMISKLKRCYPDIEFFQNLKYSELICKFKNALALFIPLRNTVQDIARFPNKICEYAACSGVIVTTNYGEIPYYFKDKINAVIAEDFTAESIAKQLDWLYNNPSALPSIKKESYLLGRNVFDIISYRETMEKYINEICGEDNS